MSIFDDIFYDAARNFTYMALDKGVKAIKKTGQAVNRFMLSVNILTALKLGEYPSAKIDKVTSDGYKEYCALSEDDFDDIMYNLLMFELKKANEYKKEFGINTYDIEIGIKDICGLVYDSQIYKAEESELFQEQYLTNDEFLEYYHGHAFGDSLDLIKLIIKNEASAYIAATSFLETSFLLTRSIHEIIYAHLKGLGFGRSYYDYLQYNSVSLENVLATAIKYIFYAYPYTNTDTSDANYFSTIENRYSKYDDYIKKLRSSENPIEHIIVNQDFTYEEIESEIRTFYLEGNEDALEGLKNLYDNFVILGNRYLSILKSIVENIETNKNLYKGLARGKSGEDFTYEYLRSVLPRDWELLRNVNVAYNGQQRENDLILISNKGIFTIEVKNYMAGSITVKNDGKVIHNIGNGVADESRSVIEQSESHVAFITRFMEENSKINHKKWYEVVHGTVVISNNEMEVDNQSSYPIFRVALLRQYILNNFDDVFTDEEVQELKDLLLSQAKADVKRKYSFLNPEFMSQESLALIQKNYSAFMSNYYQLLGRIDGVMNLTNSLTLVPRIDDEGKLSYLITTSDTSLMLSNIDEENRDFIKKLLNI